MAMGVSIVIADGSPIGFSTTILRYIGYFISSILFLGYLMIAFDSKIQGLHNIIAGTYVIETNKVNIEGGLEERRALSAASPI